MTVIISVCRVHFLYLSPYAELHTGRLVQLASLRAALEFLILRTYVEADREQMQTARRHGVFTKLNPAELDAKLNSLAANLGATTDEAKGVVRRLLEASCYQPVAGDTAVTALLALGFSHSQVKSICLTQPRLLTIFSPDMQHTDPTPSKLTYLPRNKSNWIPNYGLMIAGSYREALPRSSPRNKDTPSKCKSRKRKWLL